LSFILNSIYSNNKNLDADDLDLHKFLYNSTKLNILKSQIPAKIYKETLNQLEILKKTTKQINKKDLLLKKLSELTKLTKEEQSIVYNEDYSELTENNLVNYFNFKLLLSIENFRVFYLRKLRQEIEILSNDTNYTSRECKSLEIDIHELTYIEDIQIEGSVKTKKALKKKKTAIIKDKNRFININDKKIKLKTLNIKLDSLTASLLEKEKLLKIIEDLIINPN
jgi:hypothetical protein